MKTLKKINLRVLFTALFILSLILGMTASCNLTMSGKGYLSIKLPGAQEAARAISISSETAKNLIYKLELTRQNQTNTEYRRADETINIELDPGRWYINIVVHCLRPEVLDNLLAEGKPIEEWFSDDFSVLVGESKEKDFVDIVAGRHITKPITLKMIFSAEGDYEKKVWAGAMISVYNTETHIADDVKYEWFFAEKSDSENWEPATKDNTQHEYITGRDIEKKL